MSKIKNAINDFRDIDSVSRSSGLLSGISPIVKLIVTLLFVIFTVSKKKYDVTGILLMVIYPGVLFAGGGINFIAALKKLRIVLPIVCFIGVLEPFFDKTPVVLAGFIVRGGIVSGIILIFKGILAVMGAYLLMATTPIEDICAALRKFHVPNIIVTIILLIYRYIGILLSEGRRVVNAYELRAPGQRGIRFTAWGSLLGQMLMRSMDRADNLYQSMQLRGFSGDLFFENDKKLSVNDIIYAVIWTGVFIVISIISRMGV